MSLNPNKDGKRAEVEARHQAEMAGRPRIQSDVVARLDLGDRIRVALAGVVRLKLDIVCEHNPGRVDGKVFVYTTRRPPLEKPTLDDARPPGRRPGASR